MSHAFTFRKPLKRASHLRSLEPRYMFDGAAVVDASHAAQAAASEAAALRAITEAPAAVDARSPDASREAARKEVVFVDTSLANHRQLMADMAPGRTVVEFDGSREGLTQLAQWAQQAWARGGFDAMHILSHGDAGRLLLGTTPFDATTIQTDVTRAALATLGGALRDGGDILLYGCEIGAGERGTALLTALSEATGADVAASDDDTGAARLGGDWQLERQVGTIEATPMAITGYEGLLAVTTFANTDGDLDYTQTSVQRTSGGRTFTFSGGGGVGGMGTDPTYGPEGLYAYEGTMGGNDIKLTIAVESGYSFDISSFKVGAASGSITIALTYGNNTTTSFTESGISTGSFTTLSSFGTAINDVKQVVITSANFGLFNDFDITDVKAIPPPPTVSDAYISITSSGSGTGGAYKIGDSVTASWNNTAGGQNQSGITAVTIDFSAFGGGSAVAASNTSGTWAASYLIAAGAGTIDQTNRNVSVSASNGGGTTTAADTTNLTVDNIAPTVTDARISISGASGTGGAFKVGDTVTATWNNTAGGDNNSDTISSVTVDFSQFGGGSAVNASNSSGTWTATYTLVAGAIDTTSRNVSVTATDNAGNTTTRADTTNATVDNIAPTVSDARISISGASGTGGAFKIGDTVTATWNNTAGGDNNSDTISSVTVDFSQFGGGSAVSASNASGTWTATYTLVAGAINGTTNRNVSVTAMDNAGNATTTADTTNATVDNVAPTTTISTKAFSSDTGNSSDFITATASQTISGTLSANLASGETVLVSLDNGATWAAASATVGQNTWALAGQTLSASNTLKVKVQDGAGNDGTTSSQAYVLDTGVPSAPSTPDMTSGTDSGTSSTDNITSDTTPTFTGTAESGSTVTLYDTDGTTVLGTATATGGNWSITASTLSEGSHTLTAKASDAAGNVSSASSGLSVSIDASAPTGVNLDSTTFVSVNSTATSTVATLSATDSQSITYSLAVGNGTNDADNGSFTITGSSLKVGGASLTAGTYKIYVAATDAAGNVANQAFTLTVVDAPSVASIVRAGGASATVNTATTSISYTVTFDQAVTGVDTSDFTLTATGTASGNVASVSGSGTTYTVVVNTISGDGTLRLDLNSNGTGIQNGGNTAILSGYTSGQTYTLDHTAPNAPTTPDMSSGTDSGTSSTDNITRNTTPTFTGTAESGSTVTLYDTDGTTVLGTATATGGNWSITASTLSAGSHTLTAKAADAAGNVSSASSGLSVTIDTAAPVVSSVLVPSAGGYRAGTTLSFTVNTDEAVTVDTGGGTPRLALNIGGTTVYASYQSGSGSSALVFAYTVQAGDTDADGIAVTTLQANGGTLSDTAGNNMTLTLNSVGATTGVLVDTTAPTVNAVTVPGNGTYVDGSTLDFTVQFAEALTVDTSGGTPRIGLTIGSTTVYASYLSGSGTSNLVFRYTVPTGQQDTNGITVGALGANGGTLRDAAGNDATLTLNSVGSTAAVLVDSLQPTITDVTASTANGIYKAGDTITITVSFSKAVTVDTSSGTPNLALNDGGVATYTSGSGTSTLTFTHVVGNTDNTADLDYTSTSALALNNGTITDSSGTHQNASLTLATPGAAQSLGANKAIVIDTTPPAITFSALALSADTGTSSSDFITATAAQTLTATLSGSLAGGDVVYGSLDNGSTWTDITNKVSGTTLTWNGITLSGSNTLRLKVTDSAGNDGTVASQAYVLDTAAPAITFSNLALSADTGRSNSDFITTTAAQTITATLSAAPAGTDVVLGSLDNGSTWTDITSKVSGTTLAWDGATLVGASTLQLKVSDRAGNDGTPISQAYVLDATAPTIVVSNIGISNDSGTSSSDFITRTAAQTISATLSSAPAGTDVVYGSLDNGSTWTDITSKVTGTAIAWDGVTLTASGTLLIKVTDSAGNDGPAGSQAYTFDATAPTLPTVNNLSTTSTTPTLTGTATLGAGETMTLTIGNAVYNVTPSGGSWSLDLASAVPVSGTLALQAGQTFVATVTVTDAAGNAASATGALNLAIPNTVLPPPPEPPAPPPEPAPAPPVIVAAPPTPEGGSFLSPTTLATILPSASGEAAVLLGPGASGVTLSAGTRAPAETPASPPSPPLPTLTRGGEGVFQVMVLPNRSAGGDSLVLNRPLPDQVLAGSRISFAVPADTFAQTNPQARVTLAAMRADGRPLPAWLSFNPQTGRFEGTPPPGTGDVTIRVIARDAQGHEAVTVFKIKVQPNRPDRNTQSPQEPAGRASLSTQIRLAADKQMAAKKLERTPG
ncbi:MAG: Ig-like domain-containing protein [Aquabacterium sp.]